MNEKNKPSFLKRFGLSLGALLAPVVSFAQVTAPTAPSSGFSQYVSFTNLLGDMTYMGYLLVGVGTLWVTIRYVIRLLRRA